MLTAVPKFPVSMPLTVVWALALVVCLLVFVQAIIRLHRKGKRRAIGLIFTALLLCGTGIHVALLVQSSHTVTAGNWIQLVLVSTVASLEMFISHTVVFDDIIAAVIFREPLMMLIYLSIFAFDLVFTLAMVFLILPRRLRDRTWLWRNQGKASLDCKNHIFMGLGSNSKLLAKHVIQEWENIPENKRGTIIFVEFPDPDSHHTGLSIGELLASVFSREKELSLEQELGSDHVVTLRGRVPENHESNLCKALGLDNLAPWLENPRASLYLLSDVDAENFSCLSVLVKDHSVKAKAFYYTHENDGYESLVAGAGHRLRVLNPHVLSFMQLKLEHPELMPINFVKKAVDKQGQPLGYVENGLQAMIVGFGESGQEALRFLYEFGSFVGKDKEAAPMRIRIVDPQLDRQAGKFFTTAPGMRTVEGLEWSTQEAGNAAFWDDYRARLDKLSYVVVAMDHGKRNVEMGIAMLREAARNGKDLHHFVILVRTWNADPQLQALTNYYNAAYAPEGCPVIHCFGVPETLWKSDVISGRSLKEAAIRYSDAFRMGTNNGESWEERRKRLSAPGGNELAKRMELRRRQAMEIGQALYADTLMSLVDPALIPLAADIPVQLTKETPAHYPRQDKMYEKLDYLSANEHLHWMAALLVSGYTDGPIDELLQTHSNMVPYNQIQKDELRHLSWVSVKTILGLKQ